MSRLLLVCGAVLVFGSVAAEATTTYYLGSSGSWGTLPANGNGASTSGVAQRSQNTVDCQSGCFAKVYYIESDGSTVYGAAALTGGGTVANLGGSGSVNVYSRCSHSDAGSGGNAKCYTIY